MRFNKRFKEVEKRANDWNFQEDETWEDRNESLKEFDAEIQDIAHQLEKDNASHDSRQELKKELRNHTRKYVNNKWKIK